MMRDAIARGGRVLLALWVLTPAVPAWAGEEPPCPPESLSLEQAVSFGLLNNPAVRAAGERTSAADQQVAQSRADFFPRLDAGYVWKHFADQPYVSFETSQAAGGRSQFPTNYSTTNRWEVEVEQPLFTGFALTSKLNAAEFGKEVAEEREKETRLDLAHEIRHAFLQTLLARKLLEAARDNVESLKLHRRNAVAYYDEGLTPRNDVLKAEVALAEAEQRERRAAEQLTVGRARLNRLLDLELQAEIQLVEPNIVPRPLPSFSELYAVAERSRPELQALEAAARRTDEESRAARSDYLPHLSAFGQYYREGNDLLADENKFTNDHNAIAGIRMEWNLFRGGRTEATVGEYEHRRHSLLHELRDARLQTRFQVKRACEAILSSEANIHTSKLALEQAVESERITTLQYAEQLVIFLEVLDAQLSVLDSRVNYYRALYGYAMARADLERSLGAPIPGADR